MTEYSTSYRWEGVKRNDFVGLLRHDARDVDRENGREIAHSNQMIKPDFTSRNVSFVNDGTGRLVPMTDVQQAVDFLDMRISQTQNTKTITDKKTGEQRTVPVALRKDASVVVEFVLMLDPKYTRDPRISDDAYESMTPAQRAEMPPDVAHMSAEKIAETRRLLNEMVNEVADQMGGYQNVVFVTEHWDESHPHVQMAVVPVTADGKLSKKQVLGASNKGEAQKNYQRMHDSMRQRLRAVGYNATDERVDSGRKHLGLDEFKASKDRVRLERAALAAAEAAKREAAEAAQKTKSNLAASESKLSEVELKSRKVNSKLAEVEKITTEGYEDGFRKGFADAEEMFDRKLAQFQREINDKHEKNKSVVRKLIAELDSVKLTATERERVSNIRQKIAPRKPDLVLPAHMLYGQDEKPEQEREL